MNESRDHVIAWRPDEAVRARAQLTRFIALCGLDSFDAMFERSITDVAWFTERLLQFLDIQFDPPYSEVVDLSRGIQWPRWCVGGGLRLRRWRRKRSSTTP